MTLVLQAYDFLVINIETIAVKPGVRMGIYYITTTTWGFSQSRDKCNVPSVVPSGLYFTLFFTIHTVVSPFAPHAFGV